MMVFLVALLPAVLGSDCKFMPFDCSDIFNSGQKISGIYPIYPAGDAPLWVYCEMISDGKVEDNGGWTVIQRRMDGSVNFYRPWDQYKRGFGNVESEYWLGLENMNQLTRNRKYTLRVDLEDFEGNQVFAVYSSFSVGPEADGYRLHVSGFIDGGAGESLLYHDGEKFSTFDKDQDSYEHNCAGLHLGAFWYKNCHGTNPNGVYLWGKTPNTNFFAIGDVWQSWKGLDVGLKSIRMKIKRVF
ncbi:microfibril-associated glycoprotein 4-like [Carassius gibelio]|uniref:microfibril-associated glycoprotein 4-like n=1 Tax=Carassius gibelio TaxID=101364 RepID=UPI002278C6A4|nr:microfibril-associated glycoprotein 4-like [Carassius gibelio]